MDKSKIESFRLFIFQRFFISGCKDRQKECARFARYPGYCEYTRTFMLQNCPKSCGFCDGKKYEVQVLYLWEFDIPINPTIFAKAIDDVHHRWLKKSSEWLPTMSRRPSPTKQNQAWCFVWLCIEHDSVAEDNPGAKNCSYTVAVVFR